MYKTGKIKKLIILKKIFCDLFRHGNSNLKKQVNTAKLILETRPGILGLRGDGCVRAINKSELSSKQSLKSYE